MYPVESKSETMIIKEGDHGSAVYVMECKYELPVHSYNVNKSFFVAIRVIITAMDDVLIFYVLYNLVALFSIPKSNK